MQTPIGFERWEPGNPWGDVVFDDGTKTSVHDPDGSIEAEARQYGARYNAQPKAAPEPAPEPALSGAASPNLPPSTPSPAVPAAPPLPSGAPPSPSETAALTPAPGDVQALQQGVSALPATGQSPAAQALADHGVDPTQLPRQSGPPAASPGPAGGEPISPAYQAVKALAPHLLPDKGSAEYQGPDATTANAVRNASDVALSSRLQGANDMAQAKGLGVQAEAGAANEAYFAGWRKQMEGQGALAAAAVARDQAAAKLAQVKQAPIADHPDFPDWFVASSILGAIAGGFNQGFTGGAYKSTTVENLHRLVHDWRENQRYNRSQLVESLTEQLGDRNAALMAAGAKIKEGIADMAEQKARFARTPGAMAELKTAAYAMRAQALDDWGKTQTVVMGKTTEKIDLAQQKTGPAGNDVTKELAGMGITPEKWDKGWDKKTGQGELSAREAVQTTKQIDADIAEIQSIMAANGGTLPTKGAINIPAALVPTLSRIGYRPGMQAEDAMRLINSYLTQKAKGYGGTITASDRESAQLEFGSSSGGFLKGLERLRNANNEGIKGALAQTFPGSEQRVLDLMLQRTGSGFKGISAPQVTPLEKQNVEETGPLGGGSDTGGTRDVNPALRASPEEQARIDAELAARRDADREKEARGRAERQAEVARRPERPIPGSKL